MFKGISKILIQIYSKTNFFVMTLIFLVLSLVSFIITEMLILKLFLDNNYLIVYTKERMKDFNVLPYTQDQELELLNSISKIIDPYAFWFYYFIIVTIMFFGIGIIKVYFKSTQGDTKNV